MPKHQYIQQSIVFPEEPAMKFMEVLSGGLVDLPAGTEAKAKYRDGKLMLSGDTEEFFNLSMKILCQVMKDFEISVPIIVRSVIIDDDQGFDGLVTLVSASGVSSYDLVECGRIVAAAGATTNA
ncbi:MAG: hypothetical protein IKO41_21425 [Lachnospiraceae bacterium]|nr:hypothetical protein [Lachnospiraceae bacterium]